MVEVQTAFKQESKQSLYDKLQEMDKTPFLGWTLYPISIQKGYFKRLEQENHDPVRAKQIKKFKSEYIDEVSSYNQAMRMKDEKAKNCMAHYQHATDLHHKRLFLAQYERVCSNMSARRPELAEWFYKRQRLEIEVFKLE